MTRLDEERFRLVTGTAFGNHDLAWLRAHLPGDDSVRLEDVTSRYACFALWGPNARTILEPLTDTDVSNQAFGYMRARELTVGPVPCLALRVTFVGELGWELYCPREFATRLWDTLMAAGEPARPRPRRLQGDRVAASREGLPRLGKRRHDDRHALRGRPRLRRAHGQRVRLHRARGARGRTAPRRVASPASSSTTRARSCSAPSRCASTASPSGG